MDSHILEGIYNISNMVGGEMLSMIMLVFCYVSIIVLWKSFGVNGLYLYNAVAVIVANIQVLKVTDFMLSPEPVALGTLIFATTFLVSDIITEHKGMRQSYRGVKLSFLAQVLMTIFMVFTLAYPVVDSREAKSVQHAMEVIFTPSVRILFASLISFYISQWVDIKIFKYLKEKTFNKFIWFRLNVASLVSALVDNIIFSSLAWVIFSPNPVSLKSLIFVYILGTYGARVIVSISSTPIIYLTHKFKPEHDL